MALQLNDQDKKVYQLLKDAGIKYNVNYINSTARAEFGKEWKGDNFSIAFGSDKGGESFTYSTGIGHRAEAPKNAYGLSAKQKRLGQEHKDCGGLDRIFWTIQEAKLWAVSPTAASVLCCLLSDMDCGSYTFAEFCATLGYDEDSRKAHDIYLACQQSGTKLRKVFTGAQLEKLQELLQDY